MPPVRSDRAARPWTSASAPGPYGQAYDPNDGVAIVGMAGRWPGAGDVQAFWQNTLGAVDSITRLDADALEPSLREDMLARSNPAYVRARGLLDDIDCFDEAFFGFTPAEAALLDPQQRLFLQAAWEALEHAGHDPARVDGLVGVFAGGTANSYYLTNLLSRPDVTDRLGLLTTQMANQGHYIATRVAYKLNLRGPALNIQTACSTSLVAVCTAVQSLRSYQCDMALAGGVSVTLPQRRGYLHQEGSILSPDGVCRAFDAQAAGTVFSNGLGVVVLKRLADALADGNTIYAVIKGAALNNDGHDKLSFTAPSVQGQAEVISLAQAEAGIDPQTIAYVEAHGTGTALGDPIEVAALTQAFRAGGDVRRQACALASVKTQIGHLDAAAGVTGLIRAALALHHRTLPANLHFQSPNPRLQLEDSPFYVQDQVSPWPEGPTPRRAGVSSFGVGGTNAHVVLEEAPPRAAQQSAGGTRSGRAEDAPSPPPAQLLVLSARDEPTLNRYVGQLQQHLSTVTESCSVDDWADIAYTLQQGRRAFPCRRAWVATGPAQAARQMAQPLPRPAVSREPLRVAFLFPGQGSQQVNAGRALYEQEPVFRAEVDACAEILRAPLGLDIRSVMFPAPGDETVAREQLARTALAQPALLVVQLSLARLWAHAGVTPDVVLGHSVGEFAAACVAGTFSRDDALRLVAERGRLMQQVPPGAMLAVRAAPEELEAELAQGVDLAATNGPRATVLAGPVDAVARVESRLEARGLGCRVLPGSRAFHSAMMDPVITAFGRQLAQVVRQAPQRPWVSTLTGELITAEEACSADYWVRQLRAPVQFSRAVSTCLSWCDATLELGSGDTLTRLVLQHPQARSLLARAVSLPGRPLPASDDLHGPSAARETHEAQQPLDPAQTLDERATWLQAAGQLWCAGADLDGSAIQPGHRRRVPLPTYPFARHRHWVDPAPLVERPAAAAAVLSPAAPPRPDERPLIRQTAVPAAAPMPAEVDRRSRLMQALKTLLADLAGLEAQTLDPDANMLEWGLDSLLLTQASQALHKTLGVKVPMRALLEDLSTLNALADHLLPLLPPQVLPASPTPVSAQDREPQPLPASPAASAQAAALGMPEVPQLPSLPATSAGPAALRDWLDLFARQLAVMSQQLQLMRDGGSGQAASPSRADLVAQPRGESAGRNPRSPVPSDTPLPPQTPEPSSPAFGPFRPPQRALSGSRGAALSAEQQANLQAFLARYNNHTSRSKHLTQQNRAHLADPRSVAGYRQTLKELVYPIVTARSEGAYLWDVDGHRYVDITNGFGMILFGHNPPFVREALRTQVDTGYEIGPQTPLAGEVASAICDMVGLERAAFCATGSEAVMAAIRLARTVTGRDRIVVFSGAYHGVFDEVLVRATRSGAAGASSGTEPGRAAPIAPGIPASMVENIVVLDYGTDESLRAIEAMGPALAAVLVEPVQSRRPDLQPSEFLQALRRITSASGAALVFDEVVTGFRCHPGGAQAWFGVRADLATYGKVLGGGLPIGVVAGAARFMDALDGGSWRYGDHSAPEVGVTFFAGTFVRHPLALAAARAVLMHLREAGPALQQQLNERTTRFVAALRAEIDALQAPLSVSHFSSWFHLQWTVEPALAPLLYAALRLRGIHVWEGRPCFITTAHTSQDLDAIVVALRESWIELQGLGLLPGRSAAPLIPSAAQAALEPEEPEASAPDEDVPPIPGARKGRDQQGREAWFVPDPARPGKYLQVQTGPLRHG